MRANAGLAVTVRFVTTYDIGYSRWRCLNRDLKPLSRRDIDTLLKGRDLTGKNRADYLLHGRTVIVEQKSLEVDPATRPQNYADKLMARGQLIAFGKVSTTMLSDDLQREFPRPRQKSRRDRRQGGQADGGYQGHLPDPRRAGRSGHPEREGRHAWTRRSSITPWPMCSRKKRPTGRCATPLMTASS
jgi:hypothetical protein